MYVRYIPADPKIVIASPMRPAQLRVDPFGVVDGSGQVDNGLGFGQGSLAGVMKPKHQCSGFQRRPRLPESDCETRKTFNLHRLCTSAYKCHLDTDRCPNGRKCR